MEPIKKTKNLIINHWPLIIALLLAVILRLWNLSTIPPHLTPDEASLGYNAYSILKTGRDEYGKILPFVFKSFGDYKPGLYVYLTVPSVALFGLNEFAVRLPSALSGVVAVYLIYLVTNQLFSNKKLRIRNSKLEIGEIAAFLLAISPWHIHFSRGAWEISVFLTLTLAGIYFFLSSLKNSKFFSAKREASLIHASLFFSLTLFAYQGAKLSSALIVISLILVFWKEFKKIDKKVLVKSALLGVAIATPVIISLFQGKTGRLEVFSVFSYPRSKEYLQAFLDQGGEKVGSINYYLFHSESLNFMRGILERWFNHFSGRFLFFEGDWQNPRHSAPNHGMLLLTDLVLLITGFIGLVRRKGKARLLIFLWLVLAPLPAALSRDQVHAVRAFNMVIPLTMISTVGLFFVFGYVKQLNRRRAAGYTFIFIFYLLSFIFFLDSYFIHLPIHNAQHWQHGYKQAVEYITPIQNDYNKIIFQQSYAQPYIYFLFFQKHDPADYQKQASLVEGGVDVGLVERLDNIEFVRFSWPHATGEKGTLIIGDEVGIPPDFSRNSYRLLREIKYPDGYKTAFRILEVL